MHIETKFLHLKPPPSLGDYIDGWRVCWLGGWDRGHIFFVVMVERKQRMPLINLPPTEPADRENLLVRCGNSPQQPQNRRVGGLIP